MTATTARGYVYYTGADAAALDAATAALAASIDSDVTNAVQPIIHSTFGDTGGAFLASDDTGVTSINQTISVRFRVPTEFTPNRMIWFSTVQSGNYDVGIINWTTRARLWSKGTTAWPATGQVTETIAGGPTMVPGTEYGLCIALDNTTARFIGKSLEYSGQATGYDGGVVVSSVTSFPIPATVGAHTATVRTPLLILAEV